MRVKDKDNTKTSPSGSKGPLDSLLPLQPFVVIYDARAMIVEKMKSIMRRRTFLEGIVMNDLELDSASGARAQVQRNRLQVFFTKIRNQCHQSQPEAESEHSRLGRILGRGVRPCPPVDVGVLFALQD